MRARDRIAIAWRGYWAEQYEQFRQMCLETREEFRDFQAQWREARHWELILKRRITGKESPTRKDVRRAVREYNEREGRS
jgi:hypothetical protein